MSNKVGIGIEAQLDTSAVEQRINAFGQRVAQANKTPFNPISVKSLEDIDTARKRFEQLLRVHGELNRKVKATGQSGKAPWDLDFEAMFPGGKSRKSQMRNVMNYTFGGHNDAPSPGGGGGGSPQSGGGGWAGMAGRAAQSGLRAAGPVGNVAANSISTGMSAGFGAGMMGLMGGMLALGVGKIVGAATEKIGAAEENNIALDKLKRNLGDVNVSFNALKAVVHGSADGLKITYAEAGQLATQFAKLGNVSGGEYKSLRSELNVGVGMSRAFGLDPSQGVGVMGQLRGVGATSNTQDSRRFALLIGETIGKSGAFAKADEVMDALAGYTTSQTRATLGNANVAGYAGMFSAMVGSGAPGLDPQGAGAILQRVNAALSAGGAKGEASQFLTARVGQRLGLDPMRTQVFREGGMFATKRSMFGKDSAYSRYTGSEMAMGEDADTTHFHARMAELKRDPAYANNPMMLAMAMANDTGLTMNQAMGLMSVQSNQMGEMQKYADIGTLSGNGIGNLTKARFGSAQDRKALAAQYLGRKGDDAISDADRKAISGANTDEKLREVLSQMASKYDQEKTLGSDIRDSKSILDNIKTNLADKLVPMVNEMRHGIMYMAGVKDGKSPKDVMEAVLRAESKDKQRGIAGDYDGKIKAAAIAPDAIRADREKILNDLRKNGAGMTAADRDGKQKQVQGLTHELWKAEEQSRKDVLKLMQEKRDALDAEVKEIDKSVALMRKGNAVGEAPEAVVPDSSGDNTKTGSSAIMGVAPSSGAGRATGGGRGNINRTGVRSSSGRTGSPNASVSAFVQKYGALAESVSAELGVPADAVLGQWGLETGWGKSVIPGTHNLGNIKDFSGKGPTARDNMTGSVDAYRSYETPEAFGADYVKLMRKKRYDAVRGTKDAGAFFGALKGAGYAEDPNYVSSGVSATRMVERARAGTPLPGNAASGMTAQQPVPYMNSPLTGSVDVNLALSSEAKRFFQPQTAPISGIVSQPVPFGGGR